MDSRRNKFHFQVLGRLSGNAASQDASAHENVRLFLREP
jgi:hypothetical protein